MGVHIRTRFHVTSGPNTPQTGLSEPIRHPATSLQKHPSCLRNPQASFDSGTPDLGKISIQLARKSLHQRHSSCFTKGVEGVFSAPWRAEGSLHVALLGPATVPERGCTCDTPPVAASPVQVALLGAEHTDHGLEFQKLSQ